MRLHRLLPLILAIASLSCREKPGSNSGSSPAAPAEAAATSPQARPSPPAPSFPPSPALKIASIDMQQLFRSYHRTNEIQKALDAEHVRVKGESDARLESMRSVQTELEESAKQLADPAVAESVKAKIAQDRALRINDAVAMERERREFIELKKMQMNERMVAQMTGIVAEIRKQIEEMSRWEDYDYVFDRSGLTTSQVPFFLYTTESNDLTEAMLELLNRDREPQTKAGEDEPQQIKDAD